MDLGDILGQKQKLVKHIEVQFSLAINQIKEPKKTNFRISLAKRTKSFFSSTSRSVWNLFFVAKKFLQIFCWWICFFFRSLIVFTFTFFPQILGNFSTHAHRLSTYTHTLLFRNLSGDSHLQEKGFFPT